MTLRPDSLGTTILLTLLISFGPLSTDLYLPALPSIRTDLSTDLPTTQLTLSVFLFGFAAAQLIYGPLSDRFGRRPVLLLGIGVYILASLMCLVVQTIEQLIVARFLQSIGACSGMIARAVVRDVYCRIRAAQIFAYMTTGMALAPAIGPILGGGVVLSWGWRGCFVILLLVGLLIGILVVMFLDETNKHLDPQATHIRSLRNNYLTVIKHRHFLGYTLCAGCVFAGMFSYISVSSFILIDYFHLSPLEFGFSFCIFVLGYVSGSFISGLVVRRVGIHTLILYGTLIASLSTLLGLIFLLVGIDTVPTVVIPMSIFMFGSGFVLPNSQMGAMSPFPKIAGVASALLGFIQMMSAVIVSIGVSYFITGGALPLLIGMCTVSFVALFSARYILWSA